MHALRNPRRAQARVQSRPFGIGEYEHLELLSAGKEVAGQKPFPLARWEKERELRINALGYDKGSSNSPYEDGGASKVGKTGRIWRTRRRRDGKVSLFTHFIQRVE